MMRNKVLTGWGWHVVIVPYWDFEVLIGGGEAAIRDYWQRALP